QPVAAADRPEDHRARDPGRSRRRLPITPQAPLPEAEGSEEEDDGPAPSGSEPPVRGHRPPEEGVSEGRPAGDQRRYEEEGVAGRLLPRWRDRHPGDDRDQRPRLRQRGSGYGDPAWDLRRGAERGVHPPEH